MPAAPPLLELQQGFADELRGRSEGPMARVHPGPPRATRPGQVSAWVDGAGLDPAARLRIYQHAVAATLTATLRGSYPAVCAVVGNDFFDSMAARYQRQHPSICGNLQHFGDSLADFITAMPEAQSLAYLADLARLDWRRQLAALAADAVTVDAVRRAAAATVAPDRLRISLHPSLQLLHSDYAILTLWQWCLAPTAVAPTLAGGEYVLLWRDGNEVAMASVTAATFHCIEALAGGCDVASAYSAAAAVDSDFDLEPCLRDLLRQGLIVAFIDIDEGSCACRPC